MRNDDRGFTLLELIIAMGILGMVTVAIFSVYNTQRKVAYVETDVADVQQNVRLAVHSILKDLRMAGFMVPDGQDPIASAVDGAGPVASDLLTMNTTTASGAACRIDAEMTVDILSGAAFTLAVSSERDLDGFSAGDSVRILSPGERAQPAETAYTVVSKNAAVPSITLSPQFDGGTVDLRRGFIVARTGDSLPDTFPNTVRYCLGPAAGCAPAVPCPAGNCLMRIMNEDPSENSIVATNIGGLQFSYVLDGSTAEIAVPADLSAVRDVKIVIAGETVKTAVLSGSPKTREFAAISRIRNR
ncbi:MAG: prepilin-type N-terminal cleavage/methylation domain-containing protein [Deltaproteobacteria bacterium]|nr:prepilin-type N-terminal cleavage/methylation domain-containing protein [Deltaproteobacteria bacterium]MBZ0221232.1 prepilin-type N-terminal cleavage/methylation domain-containing protein [Deltaproteobacteria bacterium]